MGDWIGPSAAGLPRRTDGARELDVVFERALISLQGENVIGFLVDDRLRDIALTAHRVDHHDRPLDRQHAQQFGNGDDLVGFFPYLHLTENEPLARGESRHDVDRTLGVFLLLGGLRTGPSHRLAIDGDHFGRDPSLRRDPGDEATLERPGVERGQDVAQVVVRRRSIRKRPERLKKTSLCRPNLAMSVIVSAPATTASRHNSKISSSGYLTLPLCRTSGRSLK